QQWSDPEAQVLQRTQRIHLCARCVRVSSVSRSITSVPVASSVSPRRSITTGRVISSKQSRATWQGASISSRKRIATTI
ncbi:hypothetical protein PENTCL1PPCAC_8165, partial [Pristionchus entomophagus]